MEVKLAPLYQPEPLVQGQDSPHLEAYKSAIGDASDQPALSEGGIKGKHVEVIDLKETIERIERKLQEFEGVEGNVDDENFTTGSCERNEDLAFLKRMRSRTETEKKILAGSIVGYIVLIVIAAVCPVAAAAPALLMLFKAAVVVISSTLVGSGMMLLQDSETLDDEKEYFKEKGYLDKEGNPIDVLQNPVKIRLEKSLANWKKKLEAIEKEQ